MNDQEMKTYIINLGESTDRRRYMEELLCNYPQLNIEFIDAINGKLMSREQQTAAFDLNKFSHLTQYQARPGEIGCTLSHQKCYRLLMESSEKSAIIFEDDLIVNEPIQDIIPLVKKWLDCDEPRVVLLSGWFWFTSSSDFDSKHKISRVSDAYGTYAYALNRVAAKVMLDSKPWYLADDWCMFKKRGVRIFGICPHLCDSDLGEKFKTTLNIGMRIHAPFNINAVLLNKYRSLIKRILFLFGKFEKAVK